jgi:hypothetical protein
MSPTIIPQESKDTQRSRWFLGNPFVAEVRLGFAKRFAICFFPAADWLFFRDWDQSGLDVNP